MPHNDELAQEEQLQEEELQQDVVPMDLQSPFPAATAAEIEFVTQQGQLRLEYKSYPKGAAAKERLGSPSTIMTGEGRATTIDDNHPPITHRRQIEEGLVISVIKGNQVRSSSITRGESPIGVIVHQTVIVEGSTCQGKKTNA